MCFIFYLIICQPTLIYTFFPIRLSILRAQERSQGHVWKFPVTTHRHSHSVVSIQLFVTSWTVASGSSVHGIIQARILEWVAMPSLGIFSTQGSNPGLLHFRQIPYHLSHQGSLRILEWVAYPSSRESSWPRNWTRVSCIAGRFFTCWTTREDNIELSKVVFFSSGCG